MRFSHEPVVWRFFLPALSPGAALNIRRATMNDLRPIVRIWMDAVQTGMGLTPPSSAQVVDTFQKRLESPDSDYGHWVAEIDGSIAGWQGLLPCRPSPMLRWAESGTYVSMNHVGRSGHPGSAHQIRHGTRQVHEPDAHCGIPQRSKRCHDQSRRIFRMAQGGKYSPCQAKRPGSFTLRLRGPAEMMRVFGEHGFSDPEFLHSACP